MLWLLKTEPSEYSFENLVRDRTTAWTGVTNPAAVKNIRSMKAGDAVIVYHTGSVRAAVGLAKVASAPRPDPANPRSAIVEITAAGPLKTPVPLEVIRGNPLFAGSPLLTIGRLSVVPLTAAQFAALSRRVPPSPADTFPAISPASPSPSSTSRRRTSTPSS